MCYQVYKSTSLKMLLDFLATMCDHVLNLNASGHLSNLQITIIIHNIRRVSRLKNYVGKELSRVDVCTYVKVLQNILKNML